MRTEVIYVDANHAVAALVSNDLRHLNLDRNKPAISRPADNRLFVETVLWMAHIGNPWLDFPAEFGPCLIDGLGNLMSPSRTKRSMPPLLDQIAHMSAQPVIPPRASNNAPSISIDTSIAT